MKGTSYIHCTVYADEMCYPGVITSIQRTGLGIRENNNTLLRSSFVYPIQTLEEAAKNGIYNDIYGISSPLCLGTTPKIGTTYSKIIVDRDYINKNKKTLKEKLDEL